MSLAKGILVTTTFGLVCFSQPAIAADPNDFAKSMDTFLQNDANVEKLGNALERLYKKKREEQQKKAQEAESAKLEEQFDNPVNIDIGKSPFKGPKDAPITVVEFSDFECPFCSRGAKTMDDLLKEYPEKVKLVFKNLPLPFHPNAKPAAKAALAAGEQGKFWEMHDKLFENQRSLNAETFNQVAKDLGLDVDKFKKDFEKEEFDKMIEEDMALASKLGIQGTPGFFVNGVQVRGARPLPYFKDLVERWLKKSQEKS